jgi:predicted PurR-regulated permease PerM
MLANRSHEEGFLILLLLAAIAGLIWLFSPFLEALFFAMILATASYNLYQKLLPRFNGSTTLAASAMSTLVFVGVIAPVTYLLIEASLQVGQLYSDAQAWLSTQNPESLAQLNQTLLAYLPLSESTQISALEQLKANSEKMIAFAQKATIFLLEGVIGSTSSFITFLGLSVFALFFFYRDGHNIANHIKILSPLENYYDQMIMTRFANLSTVLTLSVLGIAVMQGLSFAIVAWALGLPGLFIGMAIAVASFIPIVGAALVWVPLAIYAVVQGDYVTAAILSFWGVVVTGFIIDNVMRPMMIKKITRLIGSSTDAFDVANHTLITVLSTFAGLIHFGVIGLFFGPVIAAMAITIFDVYEHKNSNTLDRT